MSVRVINQSPGILVLPALYGSAELAPGQGVVINDTAAHVRSAFGNNIPDSYLALTDVPDGQANETQPVSGGAGGAQAYVPGVSGNWPTPPTTIAGGLDAIAAASAANGRILIARQVLTAGVLYTPTVGAKRVLLRAVGGGGGGGGVANSAGGQAAVGAGGAGGDFVEKYIDPAAAIIGGLVAIGAAGAAGANTGAAGGNGGDTTILINGTTYTAKGGAGGSFAATAVAGLAAGGGFTAGSSVGDITTGQQPGEDGMIITGAVAKGGSGGSTPFGSGGLGPKVQGAGVAANGFGGGGSGGCSINAGGAVLGGVGTAGMIVVYEYS